MCVPVEVTIPDGDDSDRCYIYFRYGGFALKWYYRSREDRDEEYEWILSILDCKVNDGKHKITDPINTKYIMKSDLNLEYHPIGVIKAGEAVLSVFEVEKLEPDQLCIISYMGEEFWCYAGDLKPLE